MLVATIQHQLIVCTQVAMTCYSMSDLNVIFILCGALLSAIGYIYFLVL